MPETKYGSDEDSDDALHSRREAAVSRLRAWTERQRTSVSDHDSVEQTQIMEQAVEEGEMLLWEALAAFEGDAFQTMKGLPFSYTLKGNEMFVSRKEKSITKATVMLAFRNACEMIRAGESISGPKKLKTFGASYLYVVFGRVGALPGTSILVTGSTGFLGSRVCAYFRQAVSHGPCQAGYRVLAPSHHQLDITNLAQVQALFEAEKPDILIHCAAISDVGACDLDVEKSYAINVTGVENLAKACKACGTKMIFCSSDQIYFAAEPHTEAHTEDEPVRPCNTYGRQKLEAEQRTLALCPDAVCLRLSWLYDTVRLREQEHGNFYVNVQAALQKDGFCTFPIHDTRGVTYVGEILEYLPKVFALPGGVYNYGAENTLCTCELVRNLFRAVGMDEAAVRPNTQAFQGNPRNMAMDGSKARRFGIQFTPTLDALIRIWQCAGE
ncbi:MAG: sugar nucleotide-binding protein [Lachnospiraceae bacterium]|nr:sugar nucleotide-binding protein [Lachnospiraceae bacterium]